ncbi:MAG: hypothetical protein IJH08_08110 [Atopobiaceae bacterium]|nr:hypothetical protein [Atopobiaceae bacterium]MBQ3283764.1 hypothetical protein [Atopobiaceae bacterium]
MAADEQFELQHLVDRLFLQTDVVSKVDVVVQAKADDLGDDLLEVVSLLPGGTYKRARLCDQLNSIVTAHGWGLVYGTVE